MLTRIALGGGAGLVLAGLVALLLSAGARCADLGPRVEVHPAIRAWDAGRSP